MPLPPSNPVGRRYAAHKCGWGVRMCGCGCLGCCRALYRAYSFFVLYLLPILLALEGIRWVANLLSLQIHP